MARTSDYDFSRQNVFINPGDTPISMGPYFYIHLNEWLFRLDAAIIYHDLFLSKDLIRLIYSKLQPIFQRGKFKIKREDGTIYEDRVIYWYQDKLKELNDTMAPVYGQVITAPNVPGVLKYRKGFYAGNCQMRVNASIVMLEKIYERLYYDMYRCGVLLPKGQDPNNALSVTSR